MPNEPPTQHADSLSGLIERVTFFNEENGWAVLKVKAKGHRDNVTVVGSLPSVSAGEWVTAEGRWVQDREFGLQFRAEMLNSTAPDKPEHFHLSRFRFADRARRMNFSVQFSRKLCILRESLTVKRDRYLPCGMNLTDYHAKYFAYELTKRCSSDSVDKHQGIR
jgi:hypothetical protein